MAALNATVFALQPNVDTIYSAGLYNLSQYDLRVTVPNITDDRYWNFAFYDPYGEEFASIGIANDDVPGDYLFRRIPDGGPNWGLEEACNGDDGYQGYVNGPTSDGSMLVRVLVKNNGTDLSHVQDILSGFNVAAVPRGSSAAPLATASTDESELAS
ncbi:uncharacterized protein TRUGW13939_05583 [Talaromyces rugulosus]|uniref:DUF1254 domain-containing protein n=1 Tax=Talaromyces rugulosus TaxID=121627 RepID=A0A7H8QWM6_TALRU|nr:uncharacterized protein TRUGW13939_05583 [Talaromyces rugulosus]QKX58459.1 hypothetical protein TRUGW13939_05583 [Talaromyces rugulosus]